MLVSAQANAYDYATPLDRRISRDRAEEERRRNARRRAPFALDKEPVSAQVLSPFAARQEFSAPEDVAPPPALSTDALWTLIDAVDRGGTSPTVATPPTAQPGTEPGPSSHAESLYLLLAQVIGDDLDDMPGNEDDGSHI